MSSADAYRRLGRNLFGASDETVADLACRRGWVTAEQLEACRAQGGSLTQRLLERNLLSARQLLSLIQIRNGELRWCRRCDRNFDPRLSADCPFCAGGVGAIGRFAVVREVARGGMGLVLEAIDPDSNRRVALKLIPEREAPPEFLERLRREARIAGRLDHPHIVRIHETGVARDPAGEPMHYVAMDFVEGRTLAQIQREGGTDRAALLAIFRTVVAATAYAHAQGVWHRDLKPSNVLVEAGGRVVLADFGLARDAEETRLLTPSGAMMGTACYMAPEQVLGVTRRIDARTDVWALGVMLYEILAGRLPFVAGAPGQLLESILKEDPAPLPGALGALSLRALTKDPPGRPRDAGVLERELDAALKSDAAATR
jgi:serine/threonine-protein kinase